jgi:quercetin dioxygenase-like cupin family protein
MNKRWKSVVAVVASLAAGAVLAGDQKSMTSKATVADHVTVRPAEIQWKEGPKSLRPGAQAAVLEGNPAEKGVFAMRLKLPAGFIIAPHTHPRQERVTVISGKFQLGHGGTFDESKLQALEPGSFFSLPPGMEHFAQAAEETVVQLNSEGPWEINYVNPADDPRGKGTAQR